MKIFKNILALGMVLFLAITMSAQNYKTEKNICYRPGTTDEYQKQKCVLDFYYPADKPGYPTVIWYHGGGLTGGHGDIPRELREQGIGMVGVSYRLCGNKVDPSVTTADCVDDAAAAAAWVVENIERFGGDPSKIYLAGHSAGGYLVMMIGLDKARLAKYGVDPDKAFDAIIPFSGQAITHFQNRRDRGMGDLNPLIDENAPLFYVRGDCRPILLICGQRERELFGRYEENAYLWRMFQLTGHPDAQLLELDGFDHGTMSRPGHLILLEYIRNRK